MATFGEMEELELRQEITAFKAKYCELLSRVDRHDKELSDIVDHQEKTLSREIAELRAKTNKLHENHNWLSYVVVIIIAAIIMF